MRLNKNTSRVKEPFAMMAPKLYIKTQILSLTVVGNIILKVIKSSVSFTTRVKIFKSDLVFLQKNIEDIKKK